MSPKTKRRIRIAGIVVCAVLIAIPVAWLVAPRFLMVDSGLPTGMGEQVDAIVVLGGEPWTRPERAAQVYAELRWDELFASTPMPESGQQSRSTNHEAVWVLVSGHGDCEDVRRQLEARAVPAARIETECKSTSTFENARFSVELLREHQATNVVIVTSWFHSRRALACFQEAAPEMRFYSRPTVRPAQQGWWPNKYERDRILREYVKVLYYWVVYGVSPFV